MTENMRQAIRNQHEKSRVHKEQERNVAKQTATAAATLATLLMLLL